jgi:L-alanine-DL-glutamate epimerase-like enolase superfamily enzyme
MRITGVESIVLRLPLERPITSPTGSDRGRLDSVFVLLVRLDTDAGLRGLGFACALEGGGRALKVLVEDDLAPLVTGEDPLDHERLAAKAHMRLRGIGRRGLVAQAYSAIDLALWDLKGKAAGLPLYKLLGGARESAPAYAGDTGWIWMSPEEVLDASRPYLDQGLMGIKVKVGSAHPEKDAGRVERIREALGEDVWLAVDANQRYNYGTALSMGRFFEEEIGVDWFEEPISCEDVAGHRRLAQKLEVPLALGESLYGSDEFRAYLEQDAVAVVQPNVTRVGGLTAWLRIAALAESYHRPLAPHLLPEVGVHLACGLPQVIAVELMPWLFPVFVEPPAIVNGQIVPPNKPGLGLEVNEGALSRFPCA